MPIGPFRDFNACVAHMTKPKSEGGGGYDGDTARKICGKMKAELEEGFSWAGDIRPYPGARLIRGEAIHPVKTFHPLEWPQLRVFLEDELEKSAETLVGKPLFLDHWRPLNGKVLGARYEEGALEYVAELNDDDVLQMIRDGQIKHASVQFEWKILENVDGVAPRGLNHQHLSLLKDMQPGDPQSSVEVWEGIARQLKEAKGLAPPNPQGSETEDKSLSEKPVLKERVWTRRYVNDLPDAAFALILPGGEKDEEGKTTPRTLRKFPHHRADGSLDPPHLRNANARVPQSDLTEEQKAKAKAHLDRHKKALGIGEFAEESKETFKHGWPILKEQAEEPEQVEEIEFEVAPEPTMDELIESIEDIVESINDALDTLTNRVEALEQAQKPPEEIQEQAGEEPPKAGVPKTDRERLVAHFGEEVATKLLELIGEEAYKLLPERGTKVQEQQDQEPEKDEHGCVIGRERWDEESQTCVPIPPKELQEQQGDDYQAFMAQCMAAGKTMEQCAEEWKQQHPEETPSVEEANKTIEALKAQIQVLTQQKKELQEELKKKTVGEAIIPSSVTSPSDILKEIKRLLPERVPMSWGGHYAQLWRNLRNIIKKHESRS